MGGVEPGRGGIGRNGCARAEARAEVDSTIHPFPPLPRPNTFSSPAASTRQSPPALLDVPLVVPEHGDRVSQLDLVRLGPLADLPLVLCLLGRRRELLCAFLPSILSCRPRLRGCSSSHPSSRNRLTFELGLNDSQVQVPRNSYLAQYLQEIREGLVELALSEEQLAASRQSDWWLSDDNGGGRARWCVCSTCARRLLAGLTC